MKDIAISDYLNTEYSQAASYLTYRSLPNVVDGLKSSGRKLVYTCRRSNMKEALKVTSLGGKVTSDAGYLHGDSSIAGCIVTATQAFTGSNNVPIMTGSGNFGTRFNPEASAPRYIYSKPAPWFDSIFRKEDDVNLIQQEFEGDVIEPRFYVPTIPLLLVNGCEGIGVGFASRVLARDPRNIIKYLRARLTNKRVLASYLTPAWNGFTGTVTKVDGNKWSISGCASMTNGRIRITELPITFDYLSYVAVLNKLKDQGQILRYKDYCDPSEDKFEFEVVPSAEELQKSWDEIWQDLKLSMTLTEILACVNENNAIEDFGSISEILNRYFSIKLDYQAKKIESETVRLQKEYDDLLEVSRFIKEVVKGTLSVKKKRAEVEDAMKTKGYRNIDRLLALPLYNLTEEKAAEAVRKAELKKCELEKMKSETPQSLWLHELDELEALL